MQRYERKVAVITGAASGIGLATAKQIVAEGGRVVLADVYQAGGQAEAAELGEHQAAFFKCDVSKLEEVQALFEFAVNTFGSVDVLVNNAGMGSDLVTSDALSPETWHRVIAVDLDSVFYGCKTVVPLTRLRDGGAIVNVASISGLGGDYGFNAYNAAKGAVVNYTRSLALDHAVDHIRVNAVCPGLVATRLTTFMEKKGILPQLTEPIPMKRIGRADEIAKLICFLASDDASYMTGSIVVADGGLTASTGNHDLRMLMA